MGYLDRDDGYKRPLWIPVVVALGLLAFCVPRPSTRDRQVTASDLSSPEAVEKLLLSGSGSQVRLFGTLKRTHPEEFEGLKRMVAEQARNRPTPAQMDELILSYLIDASRRQDRYIVQAPHAQLAAYREAEIKLFEAMRTSDPELCATFAAKGSVRSTAPTAVPEELFIDHRIARLEAAAAGRDHPANRQPSMIPPTDLRTIRSAMIVQGMNTATVDAFLRNGSSALASGQDRCAASLAFIRAVHGLPEARADSVHAALLAQAS
ncbi:hypothetical protein ACFQ1E_08560 [Sphingomonas canadensis]|uniref:Uncharacterized protein n=1 Tax=Sphingomonas canadensis TaxID=1219257 RepID=A0ABW3H9P0_9SPHN|nr:hypothetical protein [Sphingomonas canadensis]MCW3836090.1 hypothetical protein [Sphingomonas canadensis]